MKREENDQFFGERENIIEVILLNLNKIYIPS